MKTPALALLIALTATPALATPFCHAPRDGNIVVFEIEIGKLSEEDRAQFYERRLRMMGIDARQTTFWNGCIQTNVRENGRISMRFYDPWSLEEIPVN
jgi:hypothetical protein